MRKKQSNYYDKMRFDKVIYFRYIPLTEKVYKDFYMQEASEIGLEVEFWDLSSLFFNNNYGQEDSSNLTNTIKFNSYKEVESAIKEQNLAKTLFISIVTYENRVIKLYKLLTKYNCILGVFGRNMFPCNPIKSSIFKRIKNITFSKIINFLKQNQATKLKRSGKIKSYDVIFLGGKMGWLGIGKIEEKEVRNSEIVSVNSDDYDNFLRLKNTSRIINNDYILFLDEYLPLHPDTVIFKIKNINSVEYYSDLNKYFTKVEQQFGIPIVIGAHPKAIRYKNEDFFEGRTVYFGKSLELSRDANFVIAHDSTSINYPVSFGKRIHFITSHAIKNTLSMTHNNILYFAEYLGCNYQYFDENEPINVIEEMSTDCYKRYKYNYQTSEETEGNLTKDIFIKFLMQ